MSGNAIYVKSEVFVLLKVLVVIISVIVVYNYNRKAPISVRVKDPKFSLLGPDSKIDYQIDDVYDQLINLKNFSFNINPQPCMNYNNGLLLVVIISSKPNNFDKRLVIRKTWGRSTDTTKVVFLMGDVGDVLLAKQIRNESLTYGDIVQGNFVDAYRNMTYKHVMGLKWVAHHCPMAKYILKTDDDVLVNMHALRHFLARQLSPWGARRLIMCQVFYRSKVVRDNSKWKVTPEEYSDAIYPDYCAGWVILYSQDVVPRLLSTAQTIPYFWIDDVQITGVIANKINVHRTQFSTLALDHRRMNLLLTKGPQYAGEFLFAPCDLSTNDISKIWKAIPK